MKKVKCYKRQKAEKYNKNQLEQVAKKCRKMRHQIATSNIFIILDDEKYLTFSNDEMPQNVGFYAFDKQNVSDAAMFEWLRFSTRIHKILCSSLSIIIHGMNLDKSPTGKLSRVTHFYRTNASSVSTLDERAADTAVCKNKKTVGTGCMWILIITAAGPNG